jgi:hypothetical protein
LQAAGSTTFNFTTLEFGLGNEGFGINNRGAIGGVIFGALDLVPLQRRDSTGPASSGKLPPVSTMPAKWSDPCTVAASYSTLSSIREVRHLERLSGAIRSEALGINSAGIVYANFRKTN